MRKTLFFLFFLLISSLSYGQFFLGGGHLNGGISHGELKQETGSLFFPSLSAIVLYEFQTQPIQIGAEFSYGVYGSKLEKRTDLYPGFNDELRLRRNNNMTSGMAVIRYLPVVNTRLTPFIEMQMGANYLYTRYKIRAAFDEEAIESGMDFQNWALAYKIGAGVQIPLDFNDNLVLELRANYQDGNSVRFLQRGDVTYLPDVDNGIFDYNVRRSKLQLITLSVGIVGYDIFK